VERHAANRNDVFAFYTGAITALHEADLGSGAIDDERLRNGLFALHSLGSVKEQIAQERGFLNGVFAAHGFAGDEYARFTEIRSAKLAAAAEFARYATEAQRANFDRAQHTSEALRGADLERAALRGPGRTDADAGAWWTSMTVLIDDLHEVQEGIGADVSAHADALRADATSALAWCVGLAVLAAGVLALLVINGVKAITGPLGQLSRQADDIARYRLPAAIEAIQTGAGEPAEPEPVVLPEQSATEIVAVAEAMDRLQQAATSLATEQAVLRRNARQSLLNLGQRNQRLIRKQLNLISEFERTELNPDTLANLFQLDHLATRMRRNAENLLVMVDETSPRQSSQPLFMVDVARAAVSEVEDYHRVLLREFDQVEVCGPAVAELAHLLSELIENGLVHSPQERMVELRGRIVESGYQLLVIDHGAGMTADELEHANARLRGEERFLVPPTSHLGHYVVGRLAQRLGVRVELEDLPMGGVTARVHVPRELLRNPRVVRPEPASRTFGTHVLSERTA